MKRTKMPQPLTCTMVMDSFIGYIAREFTGLLHTLIENEKIVDVTVQHIIFRVFSFFFFLRKLDITCINHGQ